MSRLGPVVWILLCFISGTFSCFISLPVLLLPLLCSLCMEILLVGMGPSVLITVLKNKLIFVAVFLLFLQLSLSVYFCSFSWRITRFLSATLVLIFFFNISSVISLSSSNIFLLSLLIFLIAPSYFVDATSLLISLNVLIVFWRFFSHQYWLGCLQVPFPLLCFSVCYVCIIW